MKLPNQRNATIGDMLIFASQQNGKATSKKASSVISYCLVNIADLEPLSVIPWQSRKWAVPAWKEIQRIGIIDSLMLLTPEKPRQDEEKYSASRVKQLCDLLGLSFNKLNGRIIITRQSYSKKPKATCIADA